MKVLEKMVYGIQTDGSWSTEVQQGVMPRLWEKERTDIAISVASIVSQDNVMKHSGCKILHSSKDH